MAPLAPLAPLAPAFLGRAHLGTPPPVGRDATINCALEHLARERVRLIPVVTLQCLESLPKRTDGAEIVFTRGAEEQLEVIQIARGLIEDGRQFRIT